MIEVRPFADADQAAVVALLEKSMGWDRRDDDRYAQFFAWKHDQNPFGRSAAWVAVDGARVVAFRTFMRWEFVRDGERVRAARAVDTATHPDYQGQGVFTRLTTTAVEELRAEGVAFIFNTPNDKSRPGYLKMGWETIGRVPVDLRLRSPLSLARMLASRVPADKWSEKATSGVATGEVLGDGAAIGALLEKLSPPTGLSTIRSPTFLCWRYGFAPLGYRAILAGPAVTDGVAVFRVRRRGACSEVTICDLLVPENDAAVKARLVRSVLRESGADYAVEAGGGRLVGAGMVRAPRQGPVLTWRGLTDPERRPTLEKWSLVLGDIELF
ncbi:MAG TPA: GNAT family N-acetyltransferase [Acidimicrobiales bacterium]|nr:GNAT family N-acetyltransferase [Acidimicrobiales bacterium]